MSDVSERAEAALADYEEPLGWTLREDRLIGIVRDLLAELRRLERDKRVDNRINLTIGRERDALQAKIDAVKALHTGRIGMCEYCTDGPLVPYPCDTIQALGEP